MLAPGHPQYSINGMIGDGLVAGLCETHVLIRLVSSLAGHEGLKGFHLVRHRHYLHHSRAPQVL